MRREQNGGAKREVNNWGGIKTSKEWVEVLKEDRVSLTGGLNEKEQERKKEKRKTNFVHCTNRKAREAREARKLE